MRTGQWTCRATAATLMLAAATCLVTAQSPPVQAKPAAIINGEIIDVANVKAVLDQRPSPVPLTAAQDKEVRQAALDMLIDDALMRQYLQKNAPAAAPAEINKELGELQEALKKQNKTLVSFLQESKQSQEQLRADVVARLQWRNYLTAHFTDAEMKKYYDANKFYFDKVLVRASHILVKVNSNATPAERQAARAKIETIRNEIAANKIDFAEAAKRYSDCPSKEKGGDIGPFPYKFVVVEPFAKAAYSLKVGQMSDIVTTDFGFHIIKTTDRTPGEASSFATIKDIVREVYAQDIDLYQRMLADQRKTAKIEVYMQ